MTLEEFLEKVCARPLPQNPIVRVRTLAKELAEGAANQVWPHQHNVYAGQNSDTRRFGLWFANVAYIKVYISNRWNNDYPDLNLLTTQGYLKYTSRDEIISLTKEGLELLQENEPADIFISYKRSESSAFALLVLSRLKAEGLEPFVDMSLIPGEAWHAGLQERIEKSDYFIMLLGKQTLKSEVCLQELTWALKSKRIIIPIWHNKFIYKPEKWNLSPEVDHVLDQTHSIRVKEESALDYNNAIVELLNRFGITP